MSFCHRGVPLHLLALGLAHAVSPRFGPAQVVFVEPAADGWKPDVVAGDLDGDGDVDVVTYLREVGVSWAENLGGTVFAPPALIAPVFSYEVQLADLDDDGDLDVVTVQGWSENLGSGAFDFHPVGVGGHGALEVADLDGDGLLDLIVGQYNAQPGVLWFANQGGGSFGAPRAVSHVASQEPVAVGLVARDLDGDGDIDVAASMDYTIYGGGLGWAANNGRGAFAPASFIEYSGREIIGVDLDRDGDTDLLGCDRWFENTGGAFAGHTVVMQFSCGDVAAADFDGDGDVDLVKSPWGDGTIGWYAASGGGFGAHQVLPTTHPTEYSAVSTADVDGDGCIDVLYVISDRKAGAEVGWFPNTCAPPVDSTPTGATGGTGDTGGPHGATAATAHTGTAGWPGPTGDTAAPSADTAPGPKGGDDGRSACGCASGRPWTEAVWLPLLWLGGTRRRSTRR